MRRHDIHENLLQIKHVRVTLSVRAASRDCSCWLSSLASLSARRSSSSFRPIASSSSRTFSSNSSKIVEEPWGRTSLLLLRSSNRLLLLRRLVLWKLAPESQLVASPLECSRSPSPAGVGGGVVVASPAKFSAVSVMNVSGKEASS